MCGKWRTGRRQASGSVQTWLNVRRTSAGAIKVAGAEQVHIDRLGNWSVRPAQVKSSANGSRAPQKHKTHDAGHVLVCSKHFWREFESAGDASLLRLRPANWMWSHCSQCHVCSEGLKPKDAGMTLIEPWRIVGHWFCDSNRTTNPQHSGHTLP